MSELVVIAFKDKFTADEVLISLDKMQKDYLIDLDDAVIAVKESDGKVKLKQSLNLVKTGAVSIGWWGALVGTILGGVPGLVIGGATGATMGAISGKLSDYGIDDEFIKNLGDAMEPDSSAIFVLVRRATVDKVLAELNRFEGKVLKTSLSSEDEARLQETLLKKAA